MNQSTKQIGVALAFNIINDYIDKVVRTNEFLGDSNFFLPKEQMETAMWSLLTNTINKMEKMLDPSFQTIDTVDKLKNYLLNIPRSAFQYIGHYYDTDMEENLPNILQEMSNTIHEMMPFYEGFKYEIPWIQSIFLPLR